MALDKPELPLEIVQAMMQIPGFINDLSTLLSAGKPDPKSSKALVILSELQRSIKVVAHLGDATAESKVLHHALHTIHEEAQPIRDAYSKAISNAAGRFDSYSYSVPVVRATWMIIRGRPMADLKAVLENLRFTDDPVGFHGTDGLPDTGPLWAMGLLTRPHRIDKAFKQWDQQDDNALHSIVDELNGFVGSIEDHLQKADARILKEAQKVASHLAQLAAQLTTR